MSKRETYLDSQASRAIPVMGFGERDHSDAQKRSSIRSLARVRLPRKTGLYALLITEVRL
jgi:hypothetical protein